MAFQATYERSGKHMDVKVDDNHAPSISGYPLPKAAAGGPDIGETFTYDGHSFVYGWRSTDAKPYIFGVEPEPGPGGVAAGTTT